MTEGQTESTASEDGRSPLEQRVRSLETAVLVVGAILADILLFLGLVTPVFLGTRDKEDGASFLGMVGQAFTAAGPGEFDSGWSVLLLVAFLVLIVVVFASIIAVPCIVRRGLSKRAEATIVTVVLLLICGALGVWALVGLVVGRIESANAGPSAVLLSLGTLLSALLVFLPASRRIWKGE